jgi:RNA polymerase sigma factor (sigma-70 family)
LVKADREKTSMDVRGSANGAGIPGGAQQAPTALPVRLGPLRGERVGRALGEWQSRELRLARSFAECRDLGHEQLEDLYQETTLVLLGRSFHSEEHLRHALRWGIKHRALHLHRDERRRGEILAERAPEMQLAAESREHAHTPEGAALLGDDRLIVSEFLAELSDLERRVFWLLAEGLRYRAIAPVLKVSVNEARKASRACERKRERFQLLYDTGRLCGYRSQTILAMQAGASVTDELAQRAYAHLHACSSCRAEHKTNARRLQRSFQGQAAALLPIPLLAGRLSWLTRIELRARSLAVRVLPQAPAPGTGVVRERALALLASGGATAKLAAGVATVAVIAGGTIGATHALEHPPSQPHRAVHRHASSVAQPSNAARVANAASATDAQANLQVSEQRPVVRSRPVHSQATSASGEQREPGGFSYLGVPSTGPPPASAPVRASSASVSSAAEPSAGKPAGDEQEQEGGPFSP